MKQIMAEVQSQLAELQSKLEAEQTAQEQREKKEKVTTEE